MHNMLLKDNLHAKDEIANEVVVRHKHSSGYARTLVWGQDEFGRKLFEDENQVVLGGSLFTLEKVFGVEPSLNIETLNSIMGVANDGAPLNPQQMKDRLVCLFGVGIGGAGDTIKSTKPVNFYEREIFDMVPFRVPNVPLSSVEEQKYWFKKQLSNGKNAYYLKTFEEDPKQFTLWKDGEEGEDGSIVEDGVHETQRTEPIETFVQMHLKLSSKDIKEYFEMLGDIEATHVNSIGLFIGVKVQQEDGTYEYKEVKLFSKLNIPNEVLRLKKDIDIFYRVYTS